MADEFRSEFYDFAGGALSNEQRYMQSYENRQRSRDAASARKQKKTQSEKRGLTEAERRELEQKRIREERQARGAQSAENRRLAAMRGAFPLTDAEDPLPQDAAVPADEPQESDIDIALPEEKPEKKKASGGKPKKKKNTKQKSRPKRKAAASRYERKRTAVSQTPNRITASGAVTLGLLTGLLIGTVIYGKVQTNEVYTEIAELQAQYDDLVERNISMRSEMEGKLTVKNIEEYAVDVLGLMPLNQSQIEYIRLQTEDSVVISEPEDNFFVMVNDYLVSIWEFLRGK